MIGRWPTVTALCLVLSAGCVKPVTAPGPEGILDVLGGYPPLGLGLTAAERERRGFFAVLAPVDSVAAAVVDDRPSIRLVTPGDDSLIGRLTAVPLLAMPYLQWRWRRENITALPHTDFTDFTIESPVTVLVGFAGGGGPVAHDGPHLPPHERLLSIVWSERPADVGAVTIQGPYGRFIARGGGEGPTWWEHTVDLSELHQRLWPSVRNGDVQVTFVALASRHSRRHTVTEIADVIMTR